MEIKYVTLFAADINEQTAFCQDKLGCKIKKETSFFDGQPCTILNGQQFNINLVVIKSNDGAKHSSTVILNSKDFLKDHYELKQKGIQFQSAPEYTAGGLAAAFTDPAANRWLLLEEREYNEE
ncbi:VOC family protein [Mucilaginibacter sp. AK015]|uniref:VOC family protein n=1 Tax=Mucilaginibacter sp. AK015 TaxID=2723072 RepID=UPI001622408D|nr:VOC family protein [Mucilaginibacter sp. AK015]MBB5395290.1 catechol 2,3-dioxygenase-like lactoylglutathione lyase family enzyme [Mucilaginibacter sp. AK015]